jgi:hypothetical protein
MSRAILFFGKLPGWRDAGPGSFRGRVWRQRSGNPKALTAFILEYLSRLS